ncbi:hypothetical protein FN846DRAFT_893536 [Sphaerosporella brunnea]|uniref:Uncharacterized protein n=1 Tax=Sphaerosporella brunnea TaxID=1250544 RepID=A0A5J5EM48_9PEZI|nr:hypothetical protein FN846DRAFT_893536 [Sphaerosporella brunnea]
MIEATMDLDNFLEQEDSALARLFGEGEDECEGEEQEVVELEEEGEKEVEKKGKSEERIDAGWKSGFPERKPVAVRERRSLMTKIVGDAWEKLHRQKADLIRKSSKETGISLNPNGSEDDLLK